MLPYLHFFIERGLNSCLNVATELKKKLVIATELTNEQLKNVRLI